MKKVTLSVVVLICTLNISAQVRGGSRGSNEVNRNSNVQSVQFNQSINVYNVNDNNTNLTNSFNSNLNYQVSNINVSINPQAINNYRTNVEQNIQRSAPRNVQISQNIEVNNSEAIQRSVNYVPAVIDNQVENDYIQGNTDIALDNNNVSLPVINMPNVNIDIPTPNLEFNINKESQNKIVSQVEDSKTINTSSTETFSLPKIELDVNTPKFTIAKSNSVKHRSYKSFGYRQHVSVWEKFNAKMSGVKKILTKKTKPKKTCSVLCYQF